MNKGLVDMKLDIKEINSKADLERQKRVKYSFSYFSKTK